MKTIHPINKYGLGLLLFALLFSSCKKLEKAPEDQIPMDATAVMAVNTSGLFTKIAIDQIGELSVESVFGGEGANRPPADPDSDEARWKNLIENPDQLGVDILEDAYLIAGEQKGEKPAYLAALMVMSDAQQFQTYLNGKPPRPLQGDDREGKGFTYRLLEDGRALIGWNTHFALYLADQTNGGQDLAEEASYILNLAPDRSMTEREAFRNFQERSKDIGLFVNTQGIKKAPKWMDELEALSGFVEFTDGEASVAITHHLSEPLKEESFLKQTALQPAFDYVDFSDPVAFANLQYSSRFLANILQEAPSLRKTFANTLEGSSVSMQDLQKLFTGKLFLGCTGVTMLEKEVVEMEMDEEFNMVEKTVIKEVPTPELVIAAEAPENAWNSVMKGLTQQGIMEEEGSLSYKTAFPDMLGNTWHAHLEVLPEHLLVVNTPEKPSPQAEETPMFAESLLNEYPSAAYVNLPRLVELLPVAALGKNQEVFVQYLDSVEMGMKRGKSDKELEMHFSLKLQNQERNALVQLIALSKEWQGGVPAELPQ